MTLLAELQAICGEGHAEPAAPRHTLLGSPPRWVAAPGSTDEVAAVVGLAASHQIATVVRGGGSKLHWGPAPEVELLLDLRRLAGVVAYPPEGRQATVLAGSRLGALQSVFAARGQRLALDPPGAATVGGAISTDDRGPLRARHGVARSLLTDLTVVRGDGAVCRASSHSTGVPGYDLTALVSGGFGAFGVITEATFRLHELPAAQRWVVRTVTSPAEVRELVESVLARYPVPTAVEVNHPHGLHEGPDQLGVLLEGAPDQVARCAASMAMSLSDGDVVVTAEPPDWWHEHPFGVDDVALRLTTPPSEMYALSYVLRDVAGDAPVRCRCSPGVATMLVALPGNLEPSRVNGIVEGVRHTLIARQGSCEVLHAPDPVRQAIDMWGPTPDIELLGRARRMCDPKHVLARGRHAADQSCRR